MTAADRPALNQIALSVLDLETTARWFADGLGFLTAGGTRLLMSLPFSGTAQGIAGARSTCWFMIGCNPWAQLEMFQYSRPLGRRLPDDYRPCDIGYTRMGVHVVDFDATLARLARLGSTPVGPISGPPDQRRACVRNPDGVFVEIMEADPLPDAPRSAVDSGAALRSVTLSTPDFDASLRYFAAITGTAPSDMLLHADADEAIWGLAGARCRRAVFHCGDILLEIAAYADPAGKAWPDGYRICDIGILNIGFGLHSRADHGSAYQRALASGARPNRAPLDFGLCGMVYVNDALGFSAEILWAKDGVDFGYKPSPISPSAAPCNREITDSLSLAAAPEQVAAAVTADGFASVIRRLAGKRATIDIARAGTDSRTIRYRVARSGLFACHMGTIALIPQDGSMLLRWSMRYRCRYPGLGPIAQRIARRRLRRAMRDMRLPGCPARKE